nr:hypothetical protein [Micromonospora sp. DSM 115978]
MVPYQLIEVLGSCQVGSVWSAVDGQGTRLTVAVLDAAVAADERWRAAFTATANALAQPEAGGPHYLWADFSAPAPWVAYPVGEGGGAEQMFLALGMDYQPVPPDTGAAGHPAERPLDGTAETTQRLEPAPAQPADAGPPQPAPTDAQPAGPQPVEAQPVGPQPQSPAPVGYSPEVYVPAQQSPAPHVPAQRQPVSGAPYPVSAPPEQISPQPHPVSGAPHPTGAPVSPVGYTPYDPLTAPGRRIVPTEPTRRRRTGLWVGAASAVLVLLVGGGTFLALSGPDGTEPPVTTPSASGAPSVVMPTASPVAPGLEPPREGAWPDQWSEFSSADGIPTFPDLDGLGFTVKVPRGWRCDPAGRADGYAKYNCGGVDETGPKIGGELVVRACPDPCSQERRDAMRQAEEAWGLQWIATGPLAAYAESSSLRIDGEQRYGLVIVAYWRSGPDGVVDRQLVFRMTAPMDGANQLRRVANYLRDTLIF